MHRPRAHSLMPPIGPINPQPTPTRVPMIPFYGYSSRAMQQNLPYEPFQINQSNPNIRSRPSSGYKVQNKMNVQDLLQYEIQNQKKGTALIIQSYQRQIKRLSKIVDEKKRKQIVIQNQYKQLIEKGSEMRRQIQQMSNKRQEIEQRVYGINVQIKLQKLTQLKKQVDQSLHNEHIKQFQQLKLQQQRRSQQYNKFKEEYEKLFKQKQLKLKQYHKQKHSNSINRTITQQQLNSSIYQTQIYQKSLFHSNLQHLQQQLSNIQNYDRQNHHKINSLSYHLQNQHQKQNSIFLLKNSILLLDSHNKAIQTQQQQASIITNHISKRIELIQERIQQFQIQSTNLKAAADQLDKTIQQDCLLYRTQQLQPHNSRLNQIHDLEMKVRDLKTTLGTLKQMIASKVSYQVSKNMKDIMILHQQQY